MKHEIDLEILEVLNECARICNFCAIACMNEKDVQMLARCMRLDMDCAEICSTAAVFTERNSHNAHAVLSLCAVICDQCAEECKKHNHMDHCVLCAEVCKRCAEACRQAGRV